MQHCWGQTLPPRRLGASSSGGSQLCCTMESSGGVLKGPGPSQSLRIWGQGLPRWYQHVAEFDSTVLDGSSNRASQALTHCLFLFPIKWAKFQGKLEWAPSESEFSSRGVLKAWESSLVVQLLRLHLPMQGVWIPGWGTKISHDSRPKEQNKTEAIL